jgi:hypothetical protein
MWDVEPLINGFLCVIFLLRFQISHMFDFQMKRLVLVWTLSAATFAVANEMDQVRDLELDHRVQQVRESLHASRHLQAANCFKSSTALDAADAKLSDQFLATLAKCTGSSCSVNWAALSAYSSYRNACSALKGALATYKLAVSCSDGSSAILTNIPACLVSSRINKSCGPKLAEDPIEAIFDLGGCTETATNTGYTDYSAPKPVKRPVKKPIKIRRALAM